MVKIMDENKMMDYLADGVYGETVLTKNEIELGIELCDKWIVSHITGYWTFKDEDDKFAMEQAEELVFTTTLKLDLQKLLNK